MQRLLKNLTTMVVVVGLISMSGSLAFAHGGGGGHSAGHSSSGARNQVVHPRGPNMNSAGHGRVVSNTGAFRAPRHPTPRPPRRHPWPPYHMCYPVGFWFDGDADVADADVDDAGIDVEFTSIRQLDAGDPAKKLAPAYRVWFHNNSTVDISQPFDVAILASTDGKLAKDLPYASVRVDSLAADETMSVDIRLPIDAMSMGDSDKPAEYTFLHTLIDSQNELVETNKENNVSVYKRSDIPALDDNSSSDQ